jgi:hypothetical protein
MGTKLVAAAFVASIVPASVGARAADLVPPPLPIGYENIGSWNDRSSWHPAPPMMNRMTMNITVSMNPTDLTVTCSIGSRLRLLLDDTSVAMPERLTALLDKLDSLPGNAACRSDHACRDP